MSSKGQMSTTVDLQRIVMIMVDVSRMIPLPCISDSMHNAISKNGFAQEWHKSPLLPKSPSQYPRSRSRACARWRSPIHPLALNPHSIPQQPRNNLSINNRIFNDSRNLVWRHAAVREVRAGWKENLSIISACLRE